MLINNCVDERILILAPFGRDGEVIAQVLARDGFLCVVVAALPELRMAIDAGAGAAVIAEESLRRSDVEPLLSFLREQEPWSDFPLIVLVAKRVGTFDHHVSSRLSDFGNVILLERPLNAETLRSASVSALRGRKRQYLARDIMAERVRSAAVLRQSQADLLALNETLESRIEERTRALAQANDRLTREGMERELVQQSMVQSQKMEAIGQLTGGIAHDFNNLLNVVQGSMDLIIMLSTDEAAKKRAEVARRACVRGGKLTGQLLAFSRNQRLDLRATDVREIFDGVRELLSTSLGSGIDLQFDVAPDVQFVLADLNQIEMALLNLAINARDAMNGSGSLRISASCAQPVPPTLADGDYCRIAVADNGIGIAAENLARVFEPFFTTKGIGKGTGLGLSQVYGMAQQSGGAATVSSQAGAGTVVEIWLRTSQHHGALPPGQAELDLPRRGASILVVEDDGAVRQSMVDSLEVLGYTVAQAADGHAALAHLQRRQPDLMITDFLMPGMTGAELIRRASGIFPNLPMIVATGYADMQAIDEVIGTNTVLKKPFQLAELATAVDIALQRASVAATRSVEFE
jgi:signal transduction histidine kinase/ActR/RegA family two-component response regulator